MKAYAPLWAWVALGLALAVSLGVDFDNSAQGGAIDLRNRITGARLFAHHIDPYHYKWRDPDPAEYCDPYNNPALPVSKVTATPASLLLHLPLAALSYGPAQVLWLFLQWALLLGTASLWLRRCKTNWQRWLLALFTAGFTYTASWRLHAERGQVYVLLAFLFASWLAMTFDPKRGNGFIAGCLAGFLATLRPPFLLLAPFLALHRRGQWPGLAVGLLLGAGLPLVFNTSIWPDYFSAMHEYSQIYGSGVETPFPPTAFPETVEGISIDHLGHYASIPYADFSIYALFFSLGFFSVPALPVLLAVATPFAIWLWLSRMQRMETLLAGLAAWFFLIDLFLPAYRNSYNDVLILNVVAAALLTTDRIPRGTWPCLLALPAGWCIYGATLHGARVIDLPSFLFTAGAVWFLISSIFQKPAAQETTGTDADRKSNTRRRLSKALTG